MTLIRASDVTVHAVGFLNNQSTAVRAEQRARLHQISEATGGQAFFPTTMKDVESAYDKIVAQIRAQYSLGYTSTNTKQDGEWRKVEIKVKRPDIRIQARKGYFAPYKQ
jgi:VWFA-related protein